MSYVLDLLLLLLMVCAFVAVIWDKKTAQNWFWGVLTWPIYIVIGAIVLWEVYSEIVSIPKWFSENGGAIGTFIFATVTALAAAALIGMAIVVFTDKDSRGSVKIKKASDSKRSGDTKKFGKYFSVSTTAIFMVLMNIVSGYLNTHGSKAVIPIQHVGTVSTHHTIDQPGDLPVAQPAIDCNAPISFVQMVPKWKRIGEKDSLGLRYFYKFNYQDSIYHRTLNCVFPAELAKGQQLRSQWEIDFSNYITSGTSPEPAQHQSPRAIHPMEWDPQLVVAEEHFVHDNPPVYSSDARMPMTRSISSSAGSQSGSEGYMDGMEAALAQGIAVQRAEDNERRRRFRTWLNSDD